MEKIYPYAVSKIKAKENYLLTKANLEQLVSETSLERIVSVLREREYDFDCVQRYEDYEIVLKQEEEKLYKFVKNLIDENDFVEIFLSKNDYYNVAMILKSKIQGKEYKDCLLDSGTILKEDMLRIMENEDYDKLEQTMREAMKEAMAFYEKMQNPFVIDCILDKACFHKIKNLANKMENDFIRTYVEKLIDITNIKTFFRVRKIYKNLAIFEIAYIEGGKINQQTFIDNLETDEASLTYQFMGFSATIEQAIHHYEHLDEFCDDYMMNYMKQAKLNPLTIEPIVAYIYAKKTEFKNIRIIFTGKLNHIQDEKIKERLRESYV